jgi:hypothetical protein
MKPGTQRPPSPALSPQPGPRHRWLLFVHQLPARPTSLRVRTWRRLQQLGAIAVKQAVYVLPDSSNAREDFEWLRTEIEGAGGEATVFSADTVDTWSKDALIEEFRRSREEAYLALAVDAEKAATRLAGARRKTGIPSRRFLQQLRERLVSIERIDFFGSAGRDRVLSAIRRIEDRAAFGVRAQRGAGDDETPTYRGALWVTRPRPGVDRMSSAWLIRKFIDPDATFEFVADRESAPKDSVPFDMFGVEFTHHGDRCTFEFLCERFNLTDPALGRIAAIVHDLDLKDGRFGAAEAPAIGAVIDGLRLAHADDATLLANGLTVFEALYRSFEQAVRACGPRRVARAAAKKRR